MSAQEKSPIAAAFDFIDAGSIEDIRKLLTAHPELVNLPTFFAGGTLLHYAAAKSRAEIIELLVERGFDVARLGTTYEDSALDCACSNGRLDNVKALLRLGAKIEQRDSYNDPIFAAIIGKSPTIIELLFFSGADIKKRYTLESGAIVDSYDFALLRGEQECAAVLAKLHPRLQ